jgi:hypothetical protein
MALPDPPVEGKEVLGKVAFIVRNGQSVEPRRKLRIAERALATLVRRSDTAARIVVGVHGLRSPRVN